jgi:hypothetical protein
LSRPFCDLEVPKRNLELPDCNLAMSDCALGRPFRNRKLSDCALELPKRNLLQAKRKCARSDREMLLGNRDINGSKRGAVARTLK